LNDGSHAAQVRPGEAANPARMLLTPATPPPYAAPSHTAPPYTAPGRGHGHGRGNGAGTAAGSGRYPSVIVTSDMRKTHKTKLAKKPTPAPAPHDPDVFSTTSTP